MLFSSVYMMFTVVYWACFLHVSKVELDRTEGSVNGVNLLLLGNLPTFKILLSASCYCSSQMVLSLHTSLVRGLWFKLDSECSLYEDKPAYFWPKLQTHWWYCSSDQENHVPRYDLIQNFILFLQDVLQWVQEAVFSTRDLQPDSWRSEWGQSQPLEHNEVLRHMEEGQHGWRLPEPSQWVPAVCTQEKFLSYRNDTQMLPFLCLSANDCCNVTCHRLT